MKKIKINKSCERFLLPHILKHIKGREQEGKNEWCISFGDNHRLFGFRVDRGDHSFPVWEKEGISDNRHGMYAAVRAGQFHFRIVFVSSDLYCINDHSGTEKIESKIWEDNGER